MQRVALPGGHLLQRDPDAVYKVITAAVAATAAKP
jgi:hypothetical protein